MLPFDALKDMNTLCILLNTEDFLYLSFRAHIVAFLCWQSDHRDQTSLVEPTKLSL